MESLAVYRCCDLNCHFSMIIMVRIKEMNDDDTLKLFYLHNLVLWNRKNTYQGEVYITYIEIMAFLSLKDKRWRECCLRYRNSYLLHLKAEGYDGKRNRQSQDIQILVSAPLVNVLCGVRQLTWLTPHRGGMMSAGTSPRRDVVMMK